MNLPSQGQNQSPNPLQRNQRRTKTMVLVRSQSIVHLVAPVPHLHVQNSVLEVLWSPPMMQSVSRSKSNRVNRSFHQPQPSVEELQSQVQSLLLRLQYHPPTLDHQDLRRPLNLLKSQSLDVAELFESRLSPNLSLKQNQNLSDRKSSGTMKRKSSRTSVSKPKRRPSRL